LPGKVHGSEECARSRNTQDGMTGRGGIREWVSLTRMINSPNAFVGLIGATEAVPGYESNPPSETFARSGRQAPPLGLKSSVGMTQKRERGTRA